MAYSFSQYQDFLRCPRYFFYKHIQHIVPVEKSDAYAYGTDCHKGMAGEENGSVANKVGILARKFFGFREEEKPEVRLETFIAGIPVTFIADGVSKDHIIEAKTTSRANNFTCASHSISLQLRLGALLFNKSHGLLRMIKKSAIRQKTNESEELFWQRYIQEYVDKPGEHFLEIEIPNVAKPGTINEFLTVHQNMKHCMKCKCWPTAAPYACYGLYACDYLNMCSDPVTNAIMYKQEERNATNCLGSPGNK